MELTNEQTGQKISLEETNDIVKLRNQYALLGMNGLAYSPWARQILDKIKKLEEKTNTKQS